MLLIVQSRFCSASLRPGDANHFTLRSNSDYALFARVAAGFLATAFAGFLPLIGSSISR